jgi:hypothetical protein
MNEIYDSTQMIIAKLISLGTQKQNYNFYKQEKKNLKTNKTKEL